MCLHWTEFATKGSKSVQLATNWGHRTFLVLIFHNVLSIGSGGDALARAEARSCRKKGSENFFRERLRRQPTAAGAGAARFAGFQTWKNRARCRSRRQDQFGLGFDGARVQLTFLRKKNFSWWLFFLSLVVFSDFFQSLPESWTLRFKSFVSFWTVLYRFAKQLWLWVTSSRIESSVVHQLGQVNEEPKITFLVRCEILARHLPGHWVR